MPSKANKQLSVEKENARVRKLMGMARIADPATGEPIPLRHNPKRTGKVDAVPKKHSRDGQSVEGAAESSSNSSSDLRCETRPSFFVDMVRHHPGLSNPQWSYLEIQRVNKRVSEAAAAAAASSSKDDSTRGLLTPPPVSHMLLGVKISPLPESSGKAANREINAWATRLKPFVWLPPPKTRMQAMASLHRCPFNTVQEEDGTTAVVVAQVRSGVIP